MRTPRGTAGLLLRLTVTFGLLAFLAFWVADPREVLRRIGGAAPAAVLAAVALSVLDRVTMACKWWLLLRVRRLPVGLWSAVRAYFASSLYGLILPVTVGADAVRIVALRHAGIPDVTASIAIERGLGFIAMGSVALLSCLLLASAVADEAVRSLGLLLLAVVAVSGGMFVISLALAGRAAGWSRAPAFARRAAEAYGLYRRHPGVLALFYGLSVFESLLCAATGWILAAGLGIPLSLPTAVATVPISLAVARLPVSLGGFGVQEAAFMFFAGLVGVPRDDAFSIFALIGIAMLVALLPSAFDTRMLTLRRQAARGVSSAGETPP